MERMIRFGAAILGMLVVGLTAGLGVQRTDYAPPTGMLVLIEVDYGKQYYALFEPRTGKTVRVTPNYYEITGMGESPDGHWRYFVESTDEESGGGDELYGRLRRISLNPAGYRDEVVLDGINFRFVTWTPDHRWLLYGEKGHLFAANPLTGVRRDLTPNLPTNYSVELPSNYHIGFWEQSVIGFDGEWLLLTVRDDAHNPDIHFRVTLDGTRMEHMGNVDGTRVFFNKPENGTGYIGSDSYGAGGTFYRVSADLQESSPIMLPVASPSDMEFDSWLTGEIALLHNYVSDYSYTLFAVRVTDGQILWMVDYVVQQWYPPEGNTVFLRHFDFALDRTIVEAISPEGTDRRILPIDGGDWSLDPYSMEIFDWTPDSDWWFYTSFSFQNRRSDLHRLSADWQTDEVLWSGETTLFMREWQDNKLIFGSTSGGYTYYLINVYQLDRDTLEVKLIMQPSSHTWIIDPDGPTFEHNFHPLALMVMGGGLLGVLVWKSARFRKVHS